MAAEAVQGHLLQISEVPEQNLSLHAVSRENDARDLFFLLLFGFCFFAYIFNVLHFLMFFWFIWFLLHFLICFLQVFSFLLFYSVVF